MLKVTEDINLRDIYDFQCSFHTPYFFETNFEDNAHIKAE